MLHEKGQGYERHHLSGKASNAASHRHGKYRNPEQIDRQDRHRKIQLSADIDGTYNYRYHRLKNQQCREPVVRHLFDGINQQSEEHGIQHHALSVELRTNLLWRIMRKQLPSDDKRSQS